MIIIPIKILPGYKDSKCIVLQVSESWSWNTASSIRDLKILVAVIVENQIKLLKWKQKKCFNKSCSSWLTDCLTEYSRTSIIRTRQDLSKKAG